MDACQVLLERLWQHDVDTMYKGHDTSTLWWHNWKIILPLLGEKHHDTTMLEGKPNSLIVLEDQFLLDIKECGEIITLAMKGKTEEGALEPPPLV